MVPGQQTLVIGPSEDVDKKGVYRIQYKAFFTAYPENSVSSNEAFTVTIVDPCDSPISLTASVFEAQVYTVTQDKVEYQVPRFTPEPSWCDVSYSHQVSDALAALAV